MCFSISPSFLVIFYVYSPLVNSSAAVIGAVFYMYSCILHRSRAWAVPFLPICPFQANLWKLSITVFKMLCWSGKGGGEGESYFCDVWRLKLVHSLCKCNNHYIIAAPKTNLNVHECEHGGWDAWLSLRDCWVWIHLWNICPRKNF